jgi:hypothetical protein
VGQFSTRQLEGGPECGRPEETNKKTIEKSGYMREQTTQKYQNLDIFGSVKIQPDVVQSPGSQKITVGDAGAVDRVESVDALVLTAYTTLHVIGVLIASTILAGIGTKRNYQQRRRRRT